MVFPVGTGRYFSSSDYARIKTLPKLDKTRGGEKKPHRIFSIQRVPPKPSPPKPSPSKPNQSSPLERVESIQNLNLYFNHPEYYEPPLATNRNK